MGTIEPTPYGELYRFPASAALTITATTTNKHTPATVTLNDLQVEFISQSYESITVDNFSMADDYTPHYSINLLASRELVLALQKALELYDVN